MTAIVIPFPAPPKPPRTDLRSEFARAMSDGAALGLTALAAEIATSRLAGTPCPIMAPVIAIADLFTGEA